jgi:hypothetical protein
MKKFLFSILIIASVLQGNAQLTPITPARKIIATIQFAGSIGYLSAGLGITNRSQKLHNELLYGFVPSYYGGPLNKLSYKLTYYPFKKQISEKTTWLPISIGGILAYNLDPGYSLAPSYKKYDQDYYWWSSGLRKHITVSTALKLKSKSCENKDLILYIEANTNDLYVLTLLDNVGEMKFTDIWFLGIGAKSVF